MDGQWPETRRPDIPYQHTPSPSKLVRKPSLTTNASGIADSCISFNSYATGESLRLSQFPVPPPTLPSDPEHSPWRDLPSAPWEQDSATARPPGQPTPPLALRRNPSAGVTKALETVTEINSDSGSYRSPTSALRSPNTPRHLPYSPIPDSYSEISAHTPTSHGMSPYDWHEGSSSIQVDPTEDRMLSTSFITSLLSSTSADGRGKPPAYGAHDGQSIASSGFSDMTYPPRNADRPPPSAYAIGRYTPQSPLASDADTVRSDGDPNMHPRSASAMQPLGPRGVPVAAGSIITTSQISSGDNAVHLEPRASSIASSQTPLRNGFPVPDDGTRRKIPLGARHKSWNKRPRRDSFHSTKTTKSKVSSIVDRIANSRPVNWMRKPLPPVPTLPNMSNAQEAEYRRREGQMQLPDLVDRAGALSHMLEQGHYPHTSLHSDSLSHIPLGKEVTDEDFHAGKLGGVRQTGYSSQGWGHARARKSQQMDGGYGPDGSPPHSPKFHARFQNKSRRFWIIVATLGIIVLALAIGIGVGVSVHRDSSPKCDGNLTGSACNIDATCVCTTTASSKCSLLSQSIVSLAPTVNSLFSSNFSLGDISTAIWEVQGAPTGSNCKTQALLLDTGSALNPAIAPNRTAWARSALLWNLVQSHDLSANGAMQKFVDKAPWKALSEASTDGPTTDTDGTFSMTASGYVFDFANQTVVPMPKSFVSDGQASREQLSRVGEAVNIALDRMYTYATAASTQRSVALEYYWKSILQQSSDDLNTFMSAIRASPILLPFDATFSSNNDALSGLMTNTSTGSFPPPLACYPGLNASSLSRINTIETTVFGLPSASSNSNFDASCFPNSPIYGVLDVLRLRLPFVDSRTGVARQAVALQRDVGPRAVIYSGEALSAMPGASSLPPISGKLTDPREYGTINNVDHVVLNWLSSISDVNLATAFVRYVLSNPAVPPSNTSTLVENLASIPPLEVAVFGAVLPADVDHVVSAFGTTNGALFFGSDSALAMRNWAITAAGSSIAWTNDTAAATVVRDNSWSNEAFNAVWNPAWTYLHSQTNAIVNVGNITTAFTAIGLFGP